ncbi:MAG TPA: hypothetical protein VF062_21755, partial [Candidatus Limnocylindrales bacterium]
LVLAREDKRLAAEAEKHTLSHLAEIPAGQGRNRVFSQIRLASIRFVAGEPEQACRDAEVALDKAEHQASSMIKARLNDLLTDSQPYAHLPEVADIRDRVRETTVPA